MSRRQLLIHAAAVLAAACTRAQRPSSRPIVAEPRFERVEKRVGGRLGVFALDTGTGRRLGHREQERFAMCSTFKWILVAQALAEVDRGRLTLSQPIPYAAKDLLEYAPVTREHVQEGSLSVEELSRAAVVVSDNTAANLLLECLSGPRGLTAFVRSHGDPVTRFDRLEPMLNTNDRDDPRDTTSPAAMVDLMNALLRGNALSASSRERLLQWLRACETGKNRIRASLPPAWVAGDKTGTGNNGACNDVAIAFPPGRSPLFIAVYTSESTADVATLESAHREVTAIVLEHLR